MDSQLSQDIGRISSYRVEVSGWDASAAFFVEQTTLDWGGGDKKEISSRSTLRENGVVFVRLLQEFGKADSFPIAYRAASVEAGENGRTLVQLARLHPQAPFKATADLSAESHSKVA